MRLGDPRRGAVPDRREAQDARLVGRIDHRSTTAPPRAAARPRPPSSGCKYPGTVGNGVADLDAQDRRRRRQRVPPRGARHRVDADGRPATSSTRATRAKTDENHDAEGFFTVGDVGYLNEDGLPVPLRPQVRHDHRRRREHLPGRDRGRDPRPPATSPTSRCSASPTTTWASRSRPSSRSARAWRRTTRCARRSWSTCRGRLAKFKWPRTIDFVDELPREPTGKLLKRKLRDPYWADRQTAI